MRTMSGTSPGGLEVTPHRWARLLWLPVVFVLIAASLWWAGHPAPLPGSDQTLTASTKTGQRVYVGVVLEAPPRRKLAITEATFRTGTGSANALNTDGLTVQAWICQGGAIAQTTEPGRFCTDVVVAEGHTLRLGDGDQLMISLESSTPVALQLHPVQLTYREGLQRGTGHIGPDLQLVVLG